jgi:hypothetical protein
MVSAHDVCVCKSDLDLIVLIARARVTARSPRLHQSLVAAANTEQPTFIHLLQEICIMRAGTTLFILFL